MSSEIPGMVDRIGTPNGVDLTAAGGYVGGQTRRPPRRQPVRAATPGPAVRRSPQRSGPPGTPPRPHPAAAEAWPQTATGGRDEYPVPGTPTRGLLLWKSKAVSFTRLLNGRASAHYFCGRRGFGALHRPLHTGIAGPPQLGFAGLSFMLYTTQRRLPSVEGPRSPSLNANRPSACR
jgi:hypothetical protein